MHNTAMHTKYTTHAQTQPHQEDTHARTWPARSWRTQASWPCCADHIKAVLPSFIAASTLACACRQDSVSGASTPPQAAPDRASTLAHTHTSQSPRIWRATDECARAFSLTLSHTARAHGHPSKAPPIGRHVVAWHTRAHLGSEELAEAGIVAV